MTLWQAWVRHAGNDGHAGMLAGRARGHANISQHAMAGIQGIQGVMLGLPGGILAAHHSLKKPVFDGGRPTVNPVTVAR